MDYKKMYDNIPRGYRKDVMKESGCFKPDIHYWKEDVENKVGVDKIQRLHNAIDKHSKLHALAKLIIVRPKRKIVIESPTEIIYLDYTDLMEFQISITGTIGNAETEYELVNSAREEYENLHSKQPYKLKLLIAKKIIHDQRDDN